MLIGSNEMDNSTLLFGLEAKIIQPELNREGSNYILDNYDALIGYVIKSCDVNEDKAHDLLHDVYISIVESENNGEGFNSEYGFDKEYGDRKLMEVYQFVYGRLKAYAKNPKYRTNIVESKAVNVYTESDELVLSKHGREKESSKRKKLVKSRVHITASAASFNDGGDINENNDEFQKAFALASVADSADDIADTLSLKEQIDYCISICEMDNIQIINFFKNLDTLGEMLSEASSRKRKPLPVFSKITNLANTHSDFEEALMEILQFSSRNRAAFDIVISTY